MHTIRITQPRLRALVTMKKLLALALLLGVGLTGCAEENEGVDVDVEGDPIEDTQQNLEAAGDSAAATIDEGIDETGQALDEGVDEAGQALEDAGQDMQDGDGM